MDQDKINVLDGLINFVTHNSGKADVQMVAADLAVKYPELVDSVTTGMIQARLQEVSRGQ